MHTHLLLQSIHQFNVLNSLFTYFRRRPLNYLFSLLCRLVCPRKVEFFELTAPLKCAIITVFIFKYRPSWSGYNHNHPFPLASNKSHLMISPSRFQFFSKSPCFWLVGLAATVMDLRPFSKTTWLTFNRGSPFYTLAQSV